jgi:autotransporter-associated beta strand protein
LIRGDNFGTAAGAGVATLTGTNYAYVGQVGNAGSTDKGILPWAFGDTSLVGDGSGFVTSDTSANTGSAILRLLAVSEQTTTLATALANVNLGTSEVLRTARTFNSLRLASGGGVDLLYAPITLDSGGLLVLSGNTGISGFSGVSYLSTTSNRELIAQTVGALTLGVPIAGTTGAFTKSGAGTLTLTAGNTAHGNVSVNQGTLKLGGGNQTILPGRQLDLGQGGTLDLNGTVQQFSSLLTTGIGALAQSDLFNPDSGGTVLNSSGTQATLSLATANVNFTGDIRGDIAVMRSHTAGLFQDWNLFSEMSYTGPTLLNGGRTQLIGEGRLKETSSIEISNATLLLASNNVTTDYQNMTDKVNDAADITLRGGNLQFRAVAAIYATEQVADVILGASQNVIDIDDGGTRVNQLDVTMASLARAQDSRSTVRFFNILSGPSAASRLLVSTLNGVATTTVGAGLTNGLIGGWAVFEREFASYVPGMGVGALNTAGYAGYSPALINAGTSTENIRIATTGTTTLTAERSINSLAMVVAGTTSLDLNGFALTLGSGGLIASNSTDDTAINILNGNLTAGAFDVGGDLYLHTAGYVNGNTNVINRDVTISARLVDNGSGPVTVVVNAGDGRGTGLAGALLAEATTLSGNNTYTGGTFINAGRVILANLSADGVNSTATGTGNVTIAGGASTNGSTFEEFSTKLVFGASDQIKNTATVTVMGGATLNLNGFSQTLAGVIFDNTGGNTPTVATGAGTLFLAGNVAATGQNLGSISTISGKLNLNGANRTFNVAPVTWNGDDLNPLLPNLLISAVVDGTGDVIKTGDGLLRLSAGNAFSGNTVLQSGGLSLGGNNVLSTGALTIGHGTFLASDNNARALANDFTVTGDFALRDVFNLTLSGPGTLADGGHAISVDSTLNVLTLSGVLDDGAATASLTKTGNGILVLGNANNTYGGSTTVADGVLRFGAINAIPVGSAVTVTQGGMLDVTTGGTSVTFGSLAGDSASAGGMVLHNASSGDNVLTVGGDDSTTAFGGVIANGVGSTLSLVKTGTGVMTLGGANTYNGSTTVAAGRLIAQAVSGSSPLGSQSLVMGGASTAGILQLGNGSGALNQTFTELASGGSATSNQIVSGNASMATLTLNLAATSTFKGNIGGSGTNEGNLNLVKGSGGDLSIAGSGTSTYAGTTTVNGGKLFMDSVGAFATTTAGLTLADGTEFSLRGTTLNTVSS